MKINIQKIAYRAIPVLTAFVVLISCVAVPAMAADTVINGNTIIDYNDYVTNVEVDGDNDLVTVELPESMYGVQTIDWYGTRFLKGQHSGALTVLKNDSKVESAGLYYPGSAVTHTYLDMSNIPEDSVFNLSCKIYVAPPDDGINSFDFSGEYWATIEYRDENFEYCGNTSIERTRYNIGSLWKELKLSPDLSVRKPARAKYATIYFRFNVDTIAEYTEKYQIYYEFDIPQLKMSISSLYRLQEQTGKTNKLLESLIDGSPEQGATADKVTGELDSAGDAMQDASDELGSLGDQLSAVDKPDVDSLNVSVDGLVPYQAMLAYTAPIQALWENPTMLGMLMIVVTLVIVSWVFFGKKV